jgi:hypothetical protein
MCTVTFIPAFGDAYLTSNRDESGRRSIALPPKEYSGNGYRLIYPGDPDAGGSWIALKENRDAAVLLNGAFEKHERLPSYRKSRGMIFLEIFREQDPHSHFCRIDLQGIEPFTLVLFIAGRLWECRWDGFARHVFLLDGTKSHIWSSATLYEEVARSDKKRMFLKWFASGSSITSGKIIQFHQANMRRQAGSLINRNDDIGTVSITSIRITARGCGVHYLDLRTGLEAKTTFGQSVPGTEEHWTEKPYWFWRRFRIRLANWEYWPTHLIYGPLYLYWCWLSLRARSFFFFSAANPGIQYGGFVQERKSDIYKLIPQEYYPRTRLCDPGEPLSSLLQDLKDNGFSFPLIAKPDVGEKGIQVKLLDSEDDLSLYQRETSVHFLIQEFIAFEQEAGIFYYRMPGEIRGHISGIVGKEFVKVTGDGKSSIRSLLMREDRFLLQLPALQTAYGTMLDRVLADGIQHTIVPYGNHSRGAKFTDLKNRISDELILTVDRLCRQIPGFYYGRLDIKFNSWEELTEGRNFSIIEVNGAGSEPTHMYDPRHSLFFAWGEICRHWRLMWQISRLNVQRKKIPLMKTADGLHMLNAHFRYLRNVTRDV